ncbi:MAG: DUF116 domain-containing protein [Anaerolineaceae bacterium]|nr:DUF116 domain-containing protein [Anaerolineaceae bacterium]
MLKTLNNLSVRLRRKRCKPEELLLLFSSCLQRSACDCNLAGSLTNCRRCGQCVVCEFLDLADELGVNIFLATGGRLAAEKARDPKIKAIVAVACNKELSEGIKATFPKPLLVQELATPNGPCKDTEVDFQAVRKAVEYFLR